MEKKNVRDWSEYDENVVTRYKPMFPLYVFEHWWDLLAEENRRGHPARRKAVREFKKLGYERWRDEKGYGIRWRIESLFSAVKRTFGESVRATRFFRTSG